MRKTVTTILSLALALILVSSLSNGVIYADREREVVILDCTGFFSAPFMRVTAFDSFPDISTDLPAFPPSLAAAEVPPTFASCAETVAFLLNHKFRMEDVTAISSFSQLTTRYTFVKK